jgi:hypothetical protein
MAVRRVPPEHRAEAQGEGRRRVVKFVAISIGLTVAMLVWEWARVWRGEE